MQVQLIIYTARNNLKILSKLQEPKVRTLIALQCKVRIKIND